MGDDEETNALIARICQIAQLAIGRPALFATTWYGDVAERGDLPLRPYPEYQVCIGILKQCYAERGGCVVRLDDCKILRTHSHDKIAMKMLKFDVDPRQDPFDRSLIKLKPNQLIGPDRSHIVFGERAIKRWHKLWLRSFRRCR